MALLKCVTQPVCSQIFGKFKAVSTWRWQLRNMLTSSDNPSCTYDLVVVGGGIVGVAAAREIQLRHRCLKVAIIEKENKLAAHQSGHSSGIIHEGLYNEPGTSNADLCIKGSSLIYKYCDQRKIPYRKCGKLIVATNETEVLRLIELYAMGIKNEVPDLQFIGGKQIEYIEPFCKGIKALWCPHTSIVDWELVTEHYARDFLNAGGDIYLNSKVTKFIENTDIGSASKYPLVVYGENSRQLYSRYALTCGGLHADKLNELTTASRELRIVPIRGEYLRLKCGTCHMMRGIICSVPDLRLPYLGVHLIPQMDGNIWLGPTAVLAFKREGYTWRDMKWSELSNTLRYCGFIRLAAEHLKLGLSEMAKSTFISLHIKDIQKYMPHMTIDNIERGPSGVYAQAVDCSGNLQKDYAFTNGDGYTTMSNRVLHCLNPPTPGATSSLAFAKVIANKVEEHFHIGKGSAPTAFIARN